MKDNSRLKVSKHEVRETSLYYRIKRKNDAYTHSFAWFVFLDDSVVASDPFLRVRVTIVHSGRSPGVTSLRSLAP